jgi:hypothetical protein
MKECTILKWFYLSEVGVQQSGHIVEESKHIFIRDCEVNYHENASVEEFDPLIETVEKNNPEETKRIEEMFGGTLK